MTWVLAAGLTTAAWSAEDSCFRALQDSQPAKAVDRPIQPLPPTGEAVTLSSLALAHKMAGRFGDALADYRRTLQLEPTLGAALNGLAWLLTTYREARWRDGQEAVGVARRALAQGEDAGRLDTLVATWPR